MNLNPIPKLKGFYADSKHVMGVSYKPDMDTFMRTLKIVLIGVLILGVMGFIISEIIKLIAG
ncbi:MAG: protein translocase SEC61 complex subunit gamma [Candidatus Micrarchaeota archaeon]|nr:protein translocase SEC61 complex subunit gamma [Candidatus Micrarchaeota archaeon]MDE1849865.1 protein translocase SEC61 complex subunit gamma [Candidatus Micrarchaeota archaeon]